LCLPPFALSFTQCVAILGELDCSAGSADIINGGMNILREIARLWPGVDRAVAELSRHLEAWSEQQVEKIEKSLQETQRQLERQVLAARDRIASEELTATASRLVQQSRQLRHMLRKRLMLQSLTQSGGGDATGAAETAEGDSANPAGVSSFHHRLSGVDDGNEGCGWTIESVTALFSRSLDLHEDPLRVDTISRVCAASDRLRQSEKGWTKQSSTGKETGDEGR